jgi:hypothetical protein
MYTVCSKKRDKINEYGEVEDKLHSLTSELDGNNHRETAGTA